MDPLEEGEAHMNVSCKACGVVSSIDDDLTRGKAAIDCPRCGVSLLLSSAQTSSSSLRPPLPGSAGQVSNPLKPASSPPATTLGMRAPLPKPVLGSPPAT